MTAPAAPKPKPAITHVGRVDPLADGRLHVKGWAVDMCAARCMCHRHPGHGATALLEDSERGLLGLVSYRPQGCDCCEPWTAEELRDVVASFQQIAEMPVVEMED